MAQRIVRFTFLLMIPLLFGCGERSRSRDARGEHTFTTSDIGRPEQPQDAAGLSEEMKSAPLAFKDEAKMDVAPYVVPEPLRKRIEKSQPDLIRVQTQSFKVINQHIKISSKSATMTFTGTLQ